MVRVTETTTICQTDYTSQIFSLKLSTINDAFEKIKDWYELKGVFSLDVFQSLHIVIHCLTYTEKWKLEISKTLNESTIQA